jgi:hypothetical protein
MRAALIALPMLVAGQAWADPVTVTESKSAVIRIDPITIRKDGDLRRVWILQDMKLPESRATLSMGSLREYDCKASRFRMLSLSSHPESSSMRDVHPTGNEAGGSWSAIAPQTEAAAILSFVCAAQPEFRSPPGDDHALAGRYLRKIQSISIRSSDSATETMRPVVRGM